MDAPHGRNPDSDSLNRAKTENPSNIYRPAVLLAEDDLDMRNLLVATLLKENLEVICFDNGASLFDALQQMQQNDETIAMVISDIRMPEVTGIEVAERIRDLGWTIPIVLITAFADEQTSNSASQSGATILLSKPFKLDDFRAVVSWFLPRSEQRDQYNHSKPMGNRTNSEF